MKYGTMMAVPLVAASMVACAYTASPIPDEENDVLQYVLIAPVTLAQAVNAAEDHTVGKAVRAALVRQSGRMIYEVLVVAGARILLVKIDPVSAEVLYQSSPIT